MFWFIYHHVWNIIGTAVVLAVAAVIFATVLEAVKPGNWLTRGVVKILDILGAFVFTVACVALVGVVLFWLVYPLTPDYANRSTPRTECTSVGFGERDTVWVTPDRC